MGRRTDGELDAWLGRHARRLEALTPGAPTEDLRPLGAALRDVRVVGLGEATHGTRELFRLKHRLVEFLVTELGFTALAMEAPAAAADAVDAYVRGGSGDGARALDGLGFWIWRTHELLDLVEWLRRWNRGRPPARQVGFTGIDVQQCGPSLVVLDALLREAAPGRIADLLDPLRPSATAAPGSRPDPEGRLLALAEELAALVAAVAPADTHALRHARLLRAAVDLVGRERRHRDPERTAWAVRDAYMAEAVDGLLADPAAKVVVWAHNSHVTQASWRGTWPTLGSRLRARYGEAYYALALLLGRGGFRARRTWPGPWTSPAPGPIAVHRLGRAPAGTVEARLLAAAPGDRLLDLRGAADAPPEVRRWLHDPQGVREFGALAPRWSHRFQRAPVVLGACYDGVALVAEGSASRPLERG
ncbi:succinoglycan biosynthesis [Kitasatospora phosalacinea]|uniref:Succinoglycan biosynthesis n=1 Tax=Kitasatospora phosalacinea TaxID=2065 RepID=A0A9W6Q9X6_9ACTN|nr:erythromycin esterase family protein [Kitasatospora phosalacinea]GLW71151.1 succinoglycan biosynthesis [Kitasatospora phosalacinea]